MSLSGVIAAVPTPIDRDGRPDSERFLVHGRWALENGCDGLNVLGSTGEATSLSAAARAEVMRAAAGGLPTARLMVGTGAPDLATAVELTRLAGELGFAGALVLPPFYYTNVAEDGLFDWFHALVAGTADRAAPIYLYNFPQMTGIAFSQALVERLKAAHPERLRGAKDSSGDVAYAARLARITDFDVFPSDESTLAEAGTHGFAGTISATVNVSARLVAALWKLPEDTATARRVGAIRAGISAQPLVPAVKHLVGRRLDDPGWEAVLPPFRALDADGHAALKAVWDEVERDVAP